MDYLKLQNGSDIRGVALESPEGKEVNLTDDVVLSIGRAFGVWLAQKCEKPADELRVALGRDPRLSGERMFKKLSQGLMEMGADVFDFGIASTPCMFMSTVTPGYAYDGAAMITASHLPWNRNGIKFFTERGGLDKEDIKEILVCAQEGAFAPAAKQGALSCVDFLSVYSAQLVDKIRAGVNAPDYERPLKGFKIIVDAGNGSGGFFVEQVLRPLGADTQGSQFLEPDGAFPNHAPNPEDETAMRAITSATLEHGADLGIIFDTDVDRAGAVDSQGNEINRNRLIALISAIVLEQTPGTTIVTDSITSSGLKTFIEERGGIHHRFKRGYRNVINEAIRLNEAGQCSALAIETSGHGALRENYFLDDGAYLITLILIALAKRRASGLKLESMVQGLSEPAERREFRMDIGTADFKAYGENILKELLAYAQAKPDFNIASDNYEGVRVALDKANGNGWFLLRMSLHDPLMPLNIESDDVGGVRVIAQKLAEFLSPYDGLNMAELSEFLAAR